MPARAGTYRHGLKSRHQPEGQPHSKIRIPEKTVTVRIQARIHANNGDTCRAGALADQGVILQPDFIVGDDLRRGDLVELLPTWRKQSIGIHAVYPTRKHLPLKTRRMVDFLIAAFKDRTWR